MARSSSSERDILRLIRSRASRGSQVRVGIGDDCAVLTSKPGEELVVTTDFSIQDRHFRLNWHEPEAIGHKCLARGLSDIASMGGRPIAAFVSLAVPAALTQASGRGRAARSWLERFYTGLLALADRENVTLAGGDLSESPTLAVADIIVLGGVSKGRALLRSTARAGDILYVTGTLGGAAAELAALEKNPRAFRGVVESPLHPHFFPQPRLAAGRALAGSPGSKSLATACIDISDGLSTDLLHLCEESHLNAEIDAARLPLGAGATLEQAIHGGDDYELLFTAPARRVLPEKLGGVSIHAIGRMLPPSRGALKISLIPLKGRPARLLPQGWQHF